jgi:hypothetical protein
MADKIRVKLVRSPIGTKQRVRETVKGEMPRSFRKVFVKWL